MKFCSNRPTRPPFTKFTGEPRKRVEQKPRCVAARVRRRTVGPANDPPPHVGGYGLRTLLSIKSAFKLLIMNNSVLAATGQSDFVTRTPLPPARLDALSRDILDLKRKLNAVILAHNYQVPEIQDVADFVGDSLGLSQQAAKTGADVIVFCGVHFMAETAKILNPQKTVILPDKDAGCSLEESCPAEKLRALQATNPNFYTVTYINCSAEVKALSDVICTSGNAVKIVNASPKERDLLFVPDENLGAWVMEQTGRPMTLWQGNCYAHVEFTHASIMRIRREFPDAPLVAHPECTKAVRLLADE